MKFIESYNLKEVESLLSTFNKLIDNKHIFTTGMCFWSLDCGDIGGAEHYLFILFLKKYAEEYSIPIGKYFFTMGDYEIREQWILERIEILNNYKNQLLTKNKV